MRGKRLDLNAPGRGPGDPSPKQVVQRTRTGVSPADGDAMVTLFYEEKIDQRRIHYFVGDFWERN